MKHNFLKKTLVMMMVLMMIASIVGCSKKDQDQTSGGSIVEDNDTAQGGTETDDVDDADGEPSPDDTGKEDAADEFTLNLEGGLKDVYAQVGMIAGTCLSNAMIAQSKYTDVILANFNVVTLENFLKPDVILNRTKSVESGEITVEFPNRTTELLDWAKENGLKVRGHVLVWYSQTPDWIFYEDFDRSKSLVDRDTMLARMDSYIKQTFELLDTLGYTEIFYAYDIVNEAILDNGTFRDTLWKQIIGDDYIWHAFYFADKYAPESIKLYYNDYNEQFRTNAIVNLAKSLVDENGRYLIDGIGCQGHLYTGDSIDRYMQTLRAFSALGLEVQITELDVSLGTWQNILSPTEENLQAQGKYYYELINRIIKENAEGTTNISGITFWGFVDNLSWRHDRHPLLFDRDLNPKLAYFGAKQDYANAGIE